MNDITFEQEESLTRPYWSYTVEDFEKRVMCNPLLVYPTPQVKPGNWLVNLFRTRPLTRAEIIEKVAKDLFLTLEKRDNVYVFRFPDAWDSEDVEEMQTRVLDGIALIERKCNNTSILLEPRRNIVILCTTIFGIDIFLYLFMMLVFHFTSMASIVGCCVYSSGILIIYVTNTKHKRYKAIQRPKQATLEEIMMEQKL